MEGGNGSERTRNERGHLGPPPGDHIDRGVFEALQDPYRRFAVYFLDGRTVGIDTLADAVTAWVAASDGAVATRADRDRVAGRLHHTHLPVLEAAGLVSYDRAGDRVRLGSLSEPVRRLVAWAYRSEAGIGDALEATPPPAARAAARERPDDTDADAPTARSLDDLVAEVGRRQRLITVYSVDRRDDAVAWFATRNVTVEHESIPAGGPDGFLIVRDTDGFVGSAGLGALDGLAEPPVLPADGSLGVPDPVRQLLTLLDDTLFTAFDRRQLLATTREIEDRASRVGEGTLRVGFQRYSALRDQLPLYTRLAAETGLDVHVYGQADWEPPALDGVTYHTEPADEVGRFWFLAFDGGSDAGMACGLVAEERTPGSFTGFWTYDPGLVGALLTHLERRQD